MKNLINTKIRSLLKFSLIILICCLFFNACQEDRIDIQQDFPFELVILPVPGKIAENETVEIRLSILTSSEYIGTAYTLRYFQFEGRGQLQHHSDPPYLPNDEYILPRKEFRLYYTSQSKASHRFSIWIKDSFGNEKKLDFEFDDAS